ncbi:F-box/kelch-repeat protein [Forsythia ovata]|uniref:F-box/kelch-repeat protein n=1 Tax=Forsythia ovata TaxID=205694 RepID=A0ABD1PWC0_9LAMI
MSKKVQVKMSSDEGFLMNLPSHIIVEILSRLPAVTVIDCKVVCKKFLSLLSTTEFVKFHLSRSTPELLVFSEHVWSGAGDVCCELLELEDGIEHHDRKYNQIIKFEPEDLPDFYCLLTVLVGSVDGLVCFCNRNSEHRALYVCNLFMREYVMLPFLKWVDRNQRQVTFGFGVSTISHQYKVVGIQKSECHVYSLGTGAWRNVGGVPFAFEYYTYFGLFFNGNIHWLIKDLEGSELISCFNLEKESFQPFPPPFPGENDKITFYSLGVLEGCLCLCDSTSESDIVVWVMKEYGVKKSWIKEFVIGKLPDFTFPTFERIHALHLFKDGDILFSKGYEYLFSYSSQSKTLEIVSSVFDTFVERPMLHVSSILSLKDFALEKVRMF